MKRNGLPQMLKKLAILYFVIGILSAKAVFAETVRSKIKQGTDYYKQQKYDKALKDFIEAQIEDPENAQVNYNIGNAYYKMRNYEQAVKSYLNTTGSAKDVKLEEKSYYNLGNSFYRQGKLQQAVAYYQKALELDPDDVDAKRNLKFVKQEIEQRKNQEKERKQKDQSQKQQQQNQAGQAKQSQPDQKEKAKQQPPPQQTKNGQQGQKGEAQQPQAAGDKGEAAQKKEKEQPQQKNAQAVQQMSDEEAQRWLDSLTEDKREFLKQQLKTQPGKSYSSGKDW